jgi:hypothetical protein
VRRPPPDSVARLAREFLLLATLFAAPRRQLSPRRLQDPVMDTVSHELQRFSLGHVEFPLDTFSSEVPGGYRIHPPPPGPSVSVVPAINVFNGLLRFVQHPR